MFDGGADVCSVGMEECALLGGRGIGIERKWNGMW